MSSQYEPAAGADPVPPWSTALLSQRDLSLQVPINFVTQPAVSLTEACFASSRYEDAAARRCLSNLLAIGFKRILVDLYWDAGRGLWSLCPAEILESASSDDDSTIGIVSSTAEATLSSVTMTMTGGSLNPRQATASSTVRPSGTAVSSSPSPSSTAEGQQSVGQGVFQIGPYSCSTSLDVSAIANVVADYLDYTGDTINASLIYLIFNIHAAAPNSSPTSPASAPVTSQLPSANTTLSNVLSSALATYMYTPKQLRDDRTDLNNTWLGYDFDSRPAFGYFQTSTSATGILSTADGWPTEGVIEFGPEHLRLLASFGYIDSQMSEYNTQVDDPTIFSAGTFEAIQSLTVTDTGNVTNGCFFDLSTNYLTGSTNSSWAISSDLMLSNSTTARAYNVSDPSVSNITACGISPLLNQTLSGTADSSYESYQTVSYSSIWSWADNEPRNITSKTDNANMMRCATMRSSTRGRWVLTDCTERHHAACRNGTAPFQWRISDRAETYTSSVSLCPSGYSFDTPHTAVENRYLFSALQASATANPDDFDSDAAVWLNFNSLDISDCWVVGTDANCPYTSAENQDENRLVVIPTVAAVIVFVCAVLTFFVKCASNRRSSRKSRRRRVQEGWNYEGVPS